MLLPLWLMLATLQPPPHVFRAVASAGEVPPPLLSSAWGGLSRLASLHPSLPPSVLPGESRQPPAPGNRLLDPRERGVFTAVCVGWHPLVLNSNAKSPPALLEAGGGLTASTSAAACLEASSSCVWVSLVCWWLFLFFFFPLKKANAFFKVYIWGNAQLECMI